MEEVKKLELMIKNNSRYEEAIVLPHIWFMSQLVFK